MESFQQSERPFFLDWCANLRRSTLRNPARTKFRAVACCYSWECSKARLQFEGHFNADTLSKAVVCFQFSTPIKLGRSHQMLRPRLSLMLLAAAALGIRPLFGDAFSLLFYAAGCGPQF